MMRAFDRDAVFLPEQVAHRAFNSEFRQCRSRRKLDALSRSRGA